MSTVQMCRYGLAATAMLLGVGLIVKSHIVTGIFCLVGAVLLLPVLYKCLYIESNEVQFLSPSVFLALALFSFILLQGVPEPYEVPLKSVYTPATATTVTTTVTATTASKATTRAVTASTTVTAPITTSASVYTTTAPPVVVTTTETSPPVVTTSVKATTASVAPVGDTVFRTPNGKRYHLDASCGGKNSYEVSYEDAVEAGLTPCKKCAGG